MPQTLLLADDSVTIQRVIELTFADEDIDVVAVSDGDQAIARLNAFPPDIVLVDVGMPGKSGYEVAEYVKRTPRLAHIPVVLLTGAFEPVDQVKAAAVGCDGVLAKPFEPQLVIGRVKELLSRPARPPESLDAGLAPPVPATGFWPMDPPAGASAPGVDAPKLDDYFDQLDAALTNLSGGPPADAKTAAAASAAPADIDWFGLKPAPVAAARSDESPSFAPPLPPFATPVAAPEPPVARPLAQQPVPVAAAPLRDAVAVAPVARAAAVAETVAPPPAPRPLAPAPEPPPRSLPALADAFAAILAAEQGEPTPGAPPAWPSSAGAGQAVPDDLVEQVSRRVLAQLSDRVVREAVADTVSSVAERLVREEIERIRASIA